MEYLNDLIISILSFMAGVGTTATYYRLRFGSSLVDDDKQRKDERQAD